MARLLHAPRLGAPRRGAWRLALLLSLASPAWGLSMAPMPPAELARQAADVVIVRVESAEVRSLATGTRVEDLELRVLERLKGDADSVERRTQVVAVGTRGAGIPGNPLLEVGKTYLVFLWAPGEVPVMPLPVGGEQGVFRAEGQPGAWRFTTFGGTPVVGLTDQGPVLDVPEEGTQMEPGPGMRLVRRPALPRMSPAAWLQAWRALCEVTP